MPSKGFPEFFEVYSEGVVMTVAAITTAAFGARCLKSAAPLNVTGLVASAVAVFYSICGVSYWFVGTSALGCTPLATVRGTLMSVSNALTFLHLFLKARSSNKLNPSWKYWQVLGVSTTVFNWVTLGVMQAYLHGEEFESMAGPRCRMVYDMTTFKLKWIAQFVNQAFQVVAFALPLWQHVNSMSKHAQAHTRAGGGGGLGGRKSSSPSSRGDNLFEALVIRAVVAAAVSLVVTAVVTVLAFLHGTQRTGNEHEIPVFPLAVLDNAVNLGAIFFALNVNVSGSTTAPHRAHGVLNHVNSNFSSAIARGSSAGTSLCRLCGSQNNGLGRASNSLGRGGGGRSGGGSRGGSRGGGGGSGRSVGGGGRGSGSGGGSGIPEAIDGPRLTAGKAGGGSLGSESSGVYVTAVAAVADCASGAGGSGELGFESGTLDVNVNTPEPSPRPGGVEEVKTGDVMA